MHDPKLDFSILDPSRNEARWEKLIDSIAEQAVARHRQRLTIGFQLLSWSRPVLAAAAAVILLFGVRAVLGGGASTYDDSRRFQRAYAMISWAEGQQRPTTTHVLQIMGEPDVAE